MFNFQCKKLNWLSGYISESSPFLEVPQLNHRQLKFRRETPDNFLKQDEVSEVAKSNFLCGRPENVYYVV